MNGMMAAGLVGSLALPWVALALLMAGGPWARGKSPGRWVWLVPAAITLMLLFLAGSGYGVRVTTLNIWDWMPASGISLTLQIDGLSLFFGLVVAGMGTLIFLYTGGYFAEEPREFRKFYSYLLLFLAAMLGTVFSGNLILLYAWWELTGLASFFLIGYLHNSRESREGARMALLTTVITGMCLLAGILLVGLSAGTFEISELIERAPDMADSPQWAAGFLLILLGAFGKSAQFPFHYWLPNAMAAPTPVSAYLHSATMVKLGVFLVARIFPIFRPLDNWVPVLILVGFTTFLLGAVFALLSNKLKAILAYSTVSQLGFLIGFYGMSSPEGAHWDLLHIVNHVFYKGALFMMVGIIDHSTGIKDIRQLGGLRRRLPLLFLITLVSAASMAGLLGTSGFLSKEYMLKEKLDYLFEGVYLNYLPILIVILGSVVKVAFSLRLVLGIFMGREPEAVGAHFHKPSFGIQFPPLLLAVLTVVGGLFPALLERALAAFHVPGLHAPQAVALKIWHGWDSPAFLISCGILLAGYVLYRLAELEQWRWARIPRWMQFDAGFNRAVDYLPELGARVSRLLGVEHPKFHTPILFAVGLVWMGVPLVAAMQGTWWPAFNSAELLMAWLAALLLVSAGLCLLFVQSWKAQVILIGAIGFLMTFYFVLYRAPDLALTQILVEVATLILLLILLLRFPHLRAVPRRLPAGVTGPHGLIAVGMGALMFCMTLLFAVPRTVPALGDAYLAASLPLAKGTNAVNTILVDFRGLDTLLEIGVLVIATLGIIGLLLRNTENKPHV